MPCTTILVGKKASYDGSTLIARNDDSPSGQFHVKKMVVVQPSDQPRHYQAVESGVKIELPDNPLRYTACPNVDPSEGIWAASGINSLNVSMSATETITSNPRVLGADPYVKKMCDANGKKYPGGIGEEDLVVLVLPYIHSAREGVLRLGSLLQEYGTYEPNGIAFSDKDEIWWLETIGGHNWIARRVKDEEYVVMPNQFGMDKFDFEDAYGEKKENLCSPELKTITDKYHLALDIDDDFNPRLAYGSHTDSDHIYNTPRAWFMERYLNPRTCVWDGIDADFSPESDDIPWAMVPERKITIEDVKYLLSSHYQQTEYDPYSKINSPKKNMYRSIGVNRTSFMSIAQIRNDVKEEFSAIEWVCFGSNVFNAMIPLYTNCDVIPEYLGNTSLTVSTDNFYWASRLLGVMADSCYNFSAIHIERYQDAMANIAHETIDKYDDEMSLSEDISSLIDDANAYLAIRGKELTDAVLNKVLFESSMHMKNAFSRSDN
ncbi:MAG: C69 family dipeptidase [Bacilli bacterium]